jgi:hypothetical protein
MPVAGGPRLVPDAAPPATPGARASDPQHPARRVVLRILAAALLVAALAATAVEHRRAGALEARVADLSASLATAQAELTARRQHLDAIRSSVVDMRERVGALESLAGADPAPPLALPNR